MNPTEALMARNALLKKGDRVRFLKSHARVDTASDLPEGHTGRIIETYRSNVMVSWDQIPGRTSQTIESSLRFYEFASVEDKL